MGKLSRMSRKLGENMSREWSEHGSPELWSALRLVKSDPESGTKALTDLAQNGSPLAMMYLGNIYSRGRYGVAQDTKLGEYWLTRSASVSIEGRYQLAIFFRFMGRHDESIAEFGKLAELQYSPALFELGRIYLRGIGVDKDLKKALHYFRDGEKQGHLFAASFVGNTQLQMGFFSRIRGIIKKASCVIPIIKTIITYPNSDKIRI